MSVREIKALCQRASDAWRDTDHPALTLADVRVLRAVATRLTAN